MLRSDITSHANLLDESENQKEQHSISINFKS